MRNLRHVVPVKSKVKISQKFVAFSEYMNFTSHEFYCLECKRKPDISVIPNFLLKKKQHGGLCVCACGSSKERH